MIVSVLLNCGSHMHEHNYAIIIIILYNFLFSSAYSVRMQIIRNKVTIDYYVKVSQQFSVYFIERLIERVFVLVNIR